MTTARRGSSVATGLMLAGGIAISIGGQLHPRGSGEDLDAYLLTMTASSAWTAAHLATMVGLLLGTAGLLAARRARLFGAKVQPFLTAAIVAWTFAALELIPHVLAAGERTELAAGAATPLLSAHLWLQLLATPAFGITTMLLALSVAMSAGTRAAWALAVVATIGSLAYAAAGPVIALTGAVALSPLFAGQAGAAIWLVGTAVRLRPRRGKTAGVLRQSSLRAVDQAG